MSVLRDWRDRAACLNEDPDLFFPIGATGPAIGQTELALEVCASCPVRDECLAFALTAGMDHGVWGGHSEEGRRAIRSSPRARGSRPTHSPAEPVQITQAKTQIMPASDPAKPHPTVVSAPKA